MSERGFTLVELLVAALVSLFVAGGALLLAGAARTALLVEPASQDTVRRLREGADAIASAIASAGGDLGVGEDAGTLASGVPAVRLLRGADAAGFTGLAVIRAVQGGRGRLSEGQSGPADSLTLALADGLCPRSGLVCGFGVGDVAVVFDGRGHFDVFVIGAVSEELGRLTPRAPLSYTYPAGAWVVAVRSERLLLLRQADGAQTLTRLTAAGAREPMVDGVTRLELRAWGRANAPRLLEGDPDSPWAQYGLPPTGADAPDAEGIFADGAHCMASREGGVLRTALIERTGDADGLAPLTPADLEDGPWCPHDDAADRFDADWFRLRRVDIRFDVEVLSAQFRGPAGRLFSRGGTAGHDAPRWVRDRARLITVVVGR